MTEITVPVVAACILERDNDYLMLLDPKTGLFTLPSKIVVTGETLAEASILSVRRRIPFSMSLEGKTGIEHIDLDEPIYHIYKGRKLGGPALTSCMQTIGGEWMRVGEIYDYDYNDQVAKWSFAALTAFWGSNEKLQELSEAEQLKIAPLVGVRRRHLHAIKEAEEEQGRHRAT